VKGAGFFYLLTVPPEPSVHIFVFLTIKEIYDVIRDKESIICEKQIDLELYLACIENKRILPLDFKLEESGVENGNRLILF